MSVFAVSTSHDVMILKQTEKKFESIPTGLGSVYGSFGDSGSAILDKRGHLLGITVTNSIICSGLENMHSDEVAEHPITLIISCDTFLGIGNIGGPGVG
ncbi:unnamed protein product [Auanema sp. JU1783]|nr:unnamed protein product [Auanema sp. JU1783]